MAIDPVLIVLLAATLALTTVKGAGSQRRLTPHLARTPTQARAGAGSGSQPRPGSSGRPRTSSQGWKLWKRLERLLERSDLPLRTVEFAYMMGGGALIGGLAGRAH